MSDDSNRLVKPSQSEDTERDHSSPRPPSIPEEMINMVGGKTIDATS